MGINITQGRQIANNMNDMGVRVRRQRLAAQQGFPLNTKRKHEKKNTNEKNSQN